MSKHHLASVSVLLSVLAGEAMAYPPRYRVQAVTPVPGWNGQMIARGINDLGQVVGTVSNGAGHVRGFVWLPIAAYGLPAGATLLPNDGGNFSIATGINNAGQISGSSNSIGGGNIVRWDLTVSTAPVIVLAGGIAECISPTGLIGGNGAVLAGCPVASVFGPGTSTPVTNTECANSYATGINSAGLVVGNRYTGGQHAFFAAPPLYVGRAVVNYPGAGPGSYLLIRGVNDSGQMAGQVWHPVQNTSAFIFKDLNGDGVADPATEYTILSTPGAGACGANAISNAGEVGGTQASTGRGMMWRNGREYILNDYAIKTGTAPYPIILGVAAMNNAGQIVCRAHVSPTQLEQAVVLTAVCYANCDGSVIPPAINVLDFNCFMNSFFSGEAYANCDESTTPPVLNVVDFTCYLNSRLVFCP